MNLCSENHDEVCYDALQCPACVAIAAIQDELDDAQKELATAISQQDDLVSEIEQLEASTGS